jgi:hypothetical protein
MVAQVSQFNMLAASAHTINPFFTRHMPYDTRHVPYDTERDFTPITVLVIGALASGRLDQGGFRQHPEVPRRRPR